MKKSRLIMVLALVLVLLASCGTNGPKDAKQILEQSNQVLKTKKSYTADYSMKMGSSQDGNAITMDMTGDMKVMEAEKLMEMKMVMNMKMEGLGLDVPPTNMVAYSQADPNNPEDMLMYMQIMGMWVKTKFTMDEYQSNSMNMEASMMKILEDNKELITLVEGTEKVGDVEAYVLSGVLPGTVLKDLANLNPQAGAPKDVYPEEMALALKAYYNKATSLPMKVVMNITEEAKVKLKESATPMAIDDLEVTVTYTGFDNVDSITIPEEALNASELPDIPEVQQTN